MENEGFEDKKDAPAFTEEELKEIEEICKTSAAVKKLADRYAVIFSDPAKSFYAALAFAAKQIETHIFNGTLSSSDKKQQALREILYDGSAYYKTLEAGKNKSGDPKIHEEVDNAVQPEPEKSIGSVAEKYAKKA